MELFLLDRGSAPMKFESVMIINNICLGVTIIFISNMYSKEIRKQI